MEREFDNRIILITGGGRNVGRATALEFARRGGHVIVNYFHSQEAAEQTVEMIRAAGGSGEAIRASVAKRDALRGMFAAVRERHGGIDVLVNNAAQGVLRAMDELTDLEWEKTYRTNVHGVRWCTEYAVPLLEARDGKAVVNLSSIGSTHAVGSYAAVGSSKAAVEALTRYFAAELGPAGIRVNTASGSLLRNPVADAFPAARQVQELCDAATPLGRPSEQDLADAVVFLASTRAASITGQALVVDGGIGLGSRMMATPNGRAPAWTERTPGVSVGLRPADESGHDDGVESDSAESEGSGPRLDNLPGTDSPDAAPASRTTAVPAPWSDEAGDPDQIIAVVGMGLVVPGANSPDEFWDLLRRGEHQFFEPDFLVQEDIYSPDPKAEDRGYCKVFGGIRNFVPHPRIAAEQSIEGETGHDGAALWLRHSLLQALDTTRRRPEHRQACYVGAWPGGFRALEETVLKSTVAGSAARPGEDDDEAAAAYRRRLARLLGQHFPAASDSLAATMPEAVIRRAIFGILPDDVARVVVDTACASSVNAVDLAVKDLLTGECDIAYCGGVNSGARRDMVLFAKLHGLSHNGQVRAYDRGADGVLFSECAGVVALKRLSQAQEDGDHVLGLLAGFGGSSDGRGKSIAAPNPEGQRLALTRARAVNGTRAGEVDWIVGHGTGTPAGDSAELQTIAELSPPGGVVCTSNKAVVGHGGWTAGVVSLIHALLAMRHGEIPAQPYFTELPAGIDGSRVRVPRESVPWPSGAKPRMAAISGFGFGGTNAHLLVRDTTPDPGRPTRSAPTPQDDDIVLVGWSSHLPDDFTRADVERWLGDHGPGPLRSFGQTYPPPPLSLLPMPPVTAQTVDRCQLMGISAVHGFIEENGELWADLRDRTGVIAAHSGPSRALVDYTLRVTSAWVRRILQPGEDDDRLEATRQAFTDAMAQLRLRVPAANHDSMPGLLPNIVASRVANRFDLHGPCMTVSAGRSSTNAALHVAAQHLRFDELDVALVLSTNGNSTKTGAEVAGRPQDEVAEGAFLLMLSRASTAQEKGWPVLARVSTTHRHEDTAIPVAEWGTASDEPTYLGADGAVALLRALLTEMPAVRLTGTGAPTVSVRRTSTAEDNGVVTRPTGAPIEHLAAIDQADTAARYVVKIHREDEPSVRKALPAIPPGGVILTDSDDLAAELIDRVRRAGAVLLTTEGARAPEGAQVVDEIDSVDSVAALLDGLADAEPHLRVVSRATSRAAPAPSPALLRLHDLTFLLLKKFGPRLEHGSVGMVLLDDLVNFDIHPNLTLFTGLARALTLELTGTPVLAVVSDNGPGGALEEWEHETTTSGRRSVVRHRSGRRHVECLYPAPLPQPGGADALLGADDTVVLATGGARGITAEAMAMLAERTRAKLWLVGSSSLDDVPDDIATAADSEEVLLRSKYLTTWRMSEPDSAFPDLVRRFDGLWHKREALANLRRMQRLAVDDRVRYAACDIRDEHAVAALVDRIRGEDGHVDLVVHAAGRNRAGTLATKTLEQFREVRDTKVLGYTVLKRSLADLRPARWCSFGSLVAVMGGDGEVDYTAANEFLMSSARYARAAGEDEMAIGWSLWRDVGIGAEPSLRKAISRRGVLSAMPTAEGVRHFAAELATTSNPEAVSVYAGEKEHAVLTSMMAIGSATAVRELLSPVQHDPVERREDYARWEWRPDARRDRYLLDHVYRGYPVIPGAEFCSMAVQAAQRLHRGPGLPAETEDAEFSEFMFADVRHTPQLFSLHAERKDPQRVRVWCTSDVTDPQGKVLRRDRWHVGITIVFATAPERASSWPRLDLPSAARPIQNPYSTAGSLIQVTGSFDTLFDIQLHPDGNKGRWVSRVKSDEFFAVLPEAVTLIDAMGQLSLLRVTEDGRIPIAVPNRMKSHRWHVHGSDTELMRRFPTGLELSYFAEQDTCVATSPDGVVVAELRGIEGRVVTTLPPSCLSGNDLGGKNTQAALRPEEARAHGALQTV
ncbi:SDR family oxidoreductase [Amycolatopsis sp. cmx-11-51]|uniref:SDR family oxidoreductase n=1 Tax=Amycolatopsis sp. cmx-11-51 TaxID=2785797 RepID=UPI0039E6ACB6